MIQFSSVSQVEGKCESFCSISRLKKKFSYFVGGVEKMEIFHWMNDTGSA